MALIRIGNDNVNWTSPGLPTTRFRTSVAHGYAEYDPAPISAANQRRRQEVMTALSWHGNRLLDGLARIMQSTVTAGGIEMSAFVLRSPRNELEIGPASSGTATHAPVGVAPVGAVGFVHTHPVAEILLAPPSANDFDVSFARYPYQFVVETCGRLWLLFDSNDAAQGRGRFTALLGRIRLPLTFDPVRDNSVDFVYGVVSSDTLRTERAMADLPSMRPRVLTPMDQLRLQREAERARRMAQPGPPR